MNKTNDVDPASVDRVVLLPCPFCGPIDSTNQFHHPQVMIRTEPVAYERVPGTQAWKHVNETLEERWQRMRKWVESQIING